METPLVNWARLADVPWLRRAGLFLRQSGSMLLIALLFVCYVATHFLLEHTSAVLISEVVFLIALFVVVLLIHWQQLRSRRRNYRNFGALLDRFSIGLLVIDEKERCLLHNESFTEVFNPLAERLKIRGKVPQALHDVVCQGDFFSAPPGEADAFVGSMGKALDSPHSSSSMVSLASGGARLISHVRNSDGCSLCLCQNVSEMEGRRQGEMHSFRRFWEARGQSGVAVMAGGVAHDLGNLLAIIRGNLSLLEEDLSIDADSQKRIKRIEEGCERGRNMVANLLNIARPDGYREPLPVIELKQGVVDAALLIQSGLPDGIRLSWAVAAEDLHAQISHTSLGQILANLCLNAARAMHYQGQMFVLVDLVQLPGLGEERGLAEHLPPFSEGGSGPEAVRPRGEDRIGTEDWPRFAVGSGFAGPAARISVWDQGHGLDKKELALAFQPFVSDGESRRKRDGKGAGLGLAMVRHMVEESHGALLAESSRGRGTVFSLFLPLVQSRAEGEGVREEEERAEAEL